MFLSISHTTTYTYDQPVNLDPHTIRLTPRGDSYKRLVERALTIIPEPDGVSTNLECDGSISHLVWFNRSTMNLSFLSKSVLELNEINPYEFIVFPSQCLNLPMQYPINTLDQIKAYMAQGQSHPKVMEFANEVLIESKSNVINFVSILCQRIQQSFTYEIRQTGDAHVAHQTISSKRGSCRDLTVLYIAVAQSMGLAARYVSGYYFDQSPRHPQLHAWVEVYIPGAGWRGYDPTLGLACYGHHVALASYTHSINSSPIQGTFRGKANPQMEINLSYEYLKQPSRMVQL